MSYPQSSCRRLQLHAAAAGRVTRERHREAGGLALCPMITYFGSPDQMKENRSYKLSRSTCTTRSSSHSFADYFYNQY